MKPTCSELFCDKVSHLRGLCSKHYQQVLKYGGIKRTKFDPNEFLIDESVCKIVCYNSRGSFVGFALIDTEDVDKCKPYKWHISKYGYVVTRITNGNQTHDIRLHNLVTNNDPSSDIIKDHKNGNPLDCRKHNLRGCSQHQNMFNTRKCKRNTSGYKGVFWNKLRNKWFAKIVFNRKEYCLGYFDDKKLAALAYNEKAKELFGEFAVTNPVLIRRVK